MGDAEQRITYAFNDCPSEPPPEPFTCRTALTPGSHSAKLGRSANQANTSFGFAVFALVWRQSLAVTAPPGRTGEDEMALSIPGPRQ